MPKSPNDLPASAPPSVDPSIVGADFLSPLPVETAGGANYVDDDKVHEQSRAVAVKPARRTLKLTRR